MNNFICYFKVSEFIILFVSLKYIYVAFLSLEENNQFILSQKIVNLYPVSDLGVFGMYIND